MKGLNDDNAKEVKNIGEMRAGALWGGLLELSSRSEERV